MVTTGTPLKAWTMFEPGHAMWPEKCNRKHAAIDLQAG